MPARTVTSIPALAPFDLTDGGSPLAYDQSFTVKQQAAYIQDDIKAGDATFKLGVRLDHYDGLTSATLVQPRLGVSYAVPHSGTVLRASYGRTMETPYNENLLLSAGYGLNGRSGKVSPCLQAHATRSKSGVQQGLGRWVVVDFGYFNKHTDNGYDFSVLFNTPITFPVAWDHSRIDGFTGRLNLVEHGGSARLSSWPIRTRSIRHLAWEEFCGAAEGTSGSTMIRSSTRRRTCMPV